MQPFSEWIKQFSENRKAMMTYEDPYEKQPQSKMPKEGDIIISAPATFFRGPASRAFHKKGSGGQKMIPNPRINPWFIASQQKTGIKGDPSIEQANLVGKNYYDAIYVFNPAMKRKFNVDDILHDVTKAYGAHERFGRDVWLFIPPDQPNLKMAYNKFISSGTDNVNTDKEFDDAETAQRTKEFDTKVNVLGMDARDVINKQADTDKLKFYKTLETQVKGMLRSGQNPSLILKRAFADDERSKKPEFIDYLRRKGAVVLADYLSGKDINKTFAGPVDDLNSRIAAQKTQAPPTNYDDILSKKLSIIGGEPTEDLDNKWQTAFRKAQSTERDPRAAMKVPMPISKAESILFKGKKLIGESRKEYYEYY